MTATTFVRVRIDSETKNQASAALHTMGLSVSDAFRILMRRVAAEQAFPLELKVPNAKTQAAIEELEAGKGIKTDSIQALVKELNAQT